MPWYRSNDGLLEVVRDLHASTGRAPDIPGCIDVVQLARGGQGIVYSAIQQSTGRRVAVKVLLDGALASPDARARFEREIDLVARLRHPGIARVYDRGETADGHPYFIMEFLEGRSWREWVASENGGDDPQAARRRVLQTFVGICDAAHAAHLRGIIHRDLKPSNVRIDPTGQAHVLDFGLARPVPDASSGPSGMTVSESGVFVGSLPWASPEQVSGEADRVDVRSDVYALGVMLYHTLVGEFPYDIAGNIRDVIDGILTGIPTRPGALDRSIDGDLDAIAMKCLAKEPERRYQGVDELATDLRSYLSGEPIAAKRDSTWFAMRRMMRRYRAAVIVSIGFTLSAIGFAVAMVVLLNRAVAAEQTARQEAARATTVNGFYTMMLGSTTASDYGHDVTLRRLLAQAATHLATSPTPDPLIAGLLQHTMGLSFNGVGDWVAAEHHLRRGFDLHRDALGWSHRRTIESATELCNALQRLDRIDEAAAIMDDTVTAAHTHFGPAHHVTLSADFTRAGVAIELGDLQDAERRLRDLDERYQAMGRSDSLVTLVLALVLRDQGKLEDAEAFARQSVVDRVASHGAAHRATVTARSRLADILERRDKWAEAEAIRRDILEPCRLEFGDTGSLYLSYRTCLAGNLERQGKWDEAISLDLETITTQSTVAGDTDPETLETMLRLCRSLRATRQDDEAATWAQRGFESAILAHGAGHEITEAFRAQRDALATSTADPG